MALPDYMEYRPDARVVTLAEQASQLMVQIKQRVATANHVHNKQFIEQFVVPLFEMLTGLVQLQHGDMVRYVQHMLEVMEATKEGGAEVLVGLPQEDIDALVSELDAIKTALADPEVDTAAVAKMVTDIQEALKDRALDLDIENEGEDDDDDMVEL